MKGGAHLWIHRCMWDLDVRAEYGLCILRTILQYLYNSRPQLFYRSQIWSNRPCLVDWKFGPCAIFWFVHYAPCDSHALPTHKRIRNCVNDLSSAECRKQNKQRFRCYLRLRKTEMCKCGFTHVWRLLSHFNDIPCFLMECFIQSTLILGEVLYSCDFFKPTAVLYF